MTKGDVYRVCRMLHAYLSAAGFLTLAFFSVSGLLLNHPDWLAPGRGPAETVAAALDTDGLGRALAAAEPGGALAALVRAALPVRGGFRSAEVLDDVALLRFAGVKGASDVAIDLATGEATAEIARANLASIIRDLHRGKDAGAAWKAFIDASAIVVLALSLAGLVLFFSLRFRLAPSLWIMGGSLAVGAALFALATT